MPWNLIWMRDGASFEVLRCPRIIWLLICARWQGLLKDIRLRLWGKHTNAPPTLQIILFPQANVSVIGCRSQKSSGHIPRDTPNARFNSTIGNHLSVADLLCGLDV